MTWSGFGAPESVRVIDFTQMLADPFCTRVSELIKVELIAEEEGRVAGRAQCGLIVGPDLVNDPRTSTARAPLANRDLVFGDLESFYPRTPSRNLRNCLAARSVS